MIKDYSFELVPILYVEAEGDWPDWLYQEGEWRNLMGMSWECMTPPDEFLELEKLYEDFRVSVQQQIDAGTGVPKLEGRCVVCS